MTSKITALLSGNKGQEFIPAMKEMTLDDLYVLARQLGKVEIGGTFHPEAAKLDCNFTGDDYVFIRCTKYPDVKQNLADVIQRAEQLKAFYASHA